MKHKKFRHIFNPVNIFNFLLKEERRSGVLLIFAAIVALYLANSAWSETYFNFIHQKLSLGVISLDIKHWVSEGLMAIFFLVVTLEVKREFVDGELHGWRKASFPVVAAIGGMLLPAFIYLLVNPSLPQSAGWAIPIATDIAIAVGVLALLGRKIPKNLRIFLLALAIIDDVGSIMVIAIFFSKPSNLMALFIAITLCLSLFAFRRQKLWPISFAIAGGLIWYLFILSGISGTMAGVILAALSPLARRKRTSRTLQLSEKIEDILIPLTAYVVVPLFVFTSAGLVFNELTLSSGTGLKVFLGVVAGLVIGKPLGIFLATWLATILKLTYKPADLSWTNILGVGFVAGIGFTISLLMANLSFTTNINLQNTAIFGVFVGSVLSGLIGLIILKTHNSYKS